MQDVVAWEHFNQRGEIRGYQRTISGRIENIAILVSGAAVGDGWAWTDLVPIASQQALKVKSVVLEGSTGQGT
jgi:hypothetical protein